MEAKIELLNRESGATSAVEMKRDAAPVSVSWPVRQQVNEVMEIDKRKDKVVISGIKEGEDAHVRVDEILLELGYTKTGQVVDRVGRLNDAKKDKNLSSRKDRLVRVKLESVKDKWRLVGEAKKLAGKDGFKEIYIMPDLTRKQAEDDRLLRLKLKELREAGDVKGGVMIHRGKIVSRGGDHRVIFDPSA